MPTPCWRATAGELMTTGTPFELDLAGVRANDAREHFHQRRFARAVFPDNGMNVTAMHGEVHAVYSDNAPIALP